MAKSFALMPGPKGLPFFGNAFSYSRFGKFSFERLHLAKRAMLAEYGPLYKEKLGPAACLVQVFRPEDAEVVFRSDGRLPLRPPLPITVAAHKRDGFPLGLGSLNGEDWYELRRAVQQLFMHPSAGARYLPAQNVVAEDFLKVLEEEIDEDGYVNDFIQLMTKYTMESIATVCFNERLGCLDSKLEVGSEGHKMVTSSTALFEAVQNTTFAFPWYMVFRTRMYKQFAESKVICNNIAHGYIDRALYKKQCPVTGLDLDSVGNHTKTCPNTNGSVTNGTESTFLQTLLSTNNLHPDQAVGLTTDLFIAGIDSTANALSFVVYNLAQNPDKQEVLAREVNRVLPIGRDVTNEAMQELVYLKACVKESFRLNFPIEGGTTRILQRTLVLGGYEVPKGTLICLNNQSMCLSEEYFPEPGRYLPERWLKDGAATKRPCPPFVMLPFGFGSRMCIGRRFAEQEIYLAVIKLVQRFRITYEGPPIGMLNRVFTVPDQPLKVKLIPRR